MLVELRRLGRARAAQRGACARARYRQIKLHERTAETVAATRAVAGRDVPIMVDTNCAWLPDAATAAVMAMAPSQLLWVEEPIWPPEDFSSLAALDRKSTRLNSSHLGISYAVFCLKKKKQITHITN